MNSNDIEYLKKYLKETKLDDTFYNNAIEELKKGKPIQYIIGNVNFYGNIINVNQSVLIPRFETELLVDLTIKKIKKYFPNQKINIIDLGTGSGCIAIALKKALACDMDALDISKAALSLARTNAKNNNVDINFINKDMTNYQEKKYNIIISNPPYIKEDEEIMDIVKNNEPHIALYAKDNGLYFYKKIIDNLPYLTKDKYLACFEIGESQANDIMNYAKKHLAKVNITKEKDYSNRDRFIFITNIEN